MVGGNLVSTRCLPVAVESFRVQRETTPSHKHKAPRTTISMDGWFCNDRRYHLHVPPPPPFFLRVDVARMA